MTFSLSNRYKVDRLSPVMARAGAALAILRRARGRFGLMLTLDSLRTGHVDSPVGDTNDANLVQTALLPAGRDSEPGLALLSLHAQLG